MTDETRRILADLIERFQRARETSRGDLNETQTRVEFIDPLFLALGWDMHNRAGHAEAYKDVIHEDAIHVGGATEAPDYCFRIGGRRIFFLEAKRPSVKVKDAPAAAYQLRRYAWSAKLPLSILTDFEELAVYDCRVKPDKDDKPATARILLLSYTEYIDRWDELAAIFSKDAVLKGSFDKYAESTRLKRGTAEVDAAFLDEIEHWRETLARNFALRNELTTRELNFAVQRTIDRLIFLRMCEDRGIEPYQQLTSIANGERCYRRLCEIFYRADDKYNSGLFHFEPERGRTEAPDDLTPSLKLDDKPLKEIVRSLYYPDSPYEFSVLPAEILGQVYEQFLGKVIRLTSEHRATVEDKPEVKKAGGVYYTPNYIVDYIVRETVGKLVEGKKPKQVEKLRVLDPSCGSGSFLLGAYHFLLNWHRDFYVDDGPPKYTDKLFQGRGGQWFLTTAEKKRILLNSIYGVDIDSQAVEVTKLSLLLKVLEGETRETKQQGKLPLHLRMLPDLGKNIKCGNSLIGPDFYKDRQMSLLDEEEQYRINAFDWKGEFPDVFKSKDPGFDAVIGNPPYIRMETFKELKEYLADHYKAHEERADLYAYFIERGSRILNQTGLLGMIVSNKFIRAKYGLPLRRFLSDFASVKTIADFAGAPVFRGATVRTAVFVLGRKGLKESATVYIPVPSVSKLREMETGTLKVQDYATQSSTQLSSDALLPSEWRLLPSAHAGVVTKLQKTGTPLAQWTGSTALFGAKTGLNDAFIIDDVRKRSLIAADKKSAQVIRPIVFGRDARRYSIRDASRFVIYLHPDKDIDGYPAIKRYLTQFRKELAKRAGPQEWFELQQPATALLDAAHKPKIVYPIIANECRFAIDHDGRLINDKMFLLRTDDRALLAVLNSRLANFYFAAVCAALEGASDRYLEFRAQYVDKFPITPHLRSPKAKRLAELAQGITDLVERPESARTPQQKSVIKRQIAATDAQIDQLVYQLYELTDDEIQIVEQATAKPGERELEAQLSERVASPQDNE